MRCRHSVRRALLELYPHPAGSEGDFTGSDVSLPHTPLLSEERLEPGVILRLSYSIYDLLAMCHKKYAPIVLFLIFAAYMGGCAPSDAVETSVPEGWETNETYWWRAGFDTTGVFRNLDTFADMGVSNVGVTFVANAQATNRSGSPQDIFERRVQRSLIRLYRNQPSLVDSLFERYVRPSLTGKGDPDKMDGLVDQYQRKSYGVIRNHFQEPQTALILGKDVEVPYPDSLRERQVTGAVKTQVYLNEEGEPMAIMLLEGVHPVLDAIGLRATTQMRWRPAYRIKKGNWIPIPAWTRYNLRFKIE